MAILQAHPETYLVVLAAPAPETIGESIDSKHLLGGEGDNASKEKGKEHLPVMAGQVAWLGGTQVQVAVVGGHVLDVVEKVTINVGTPGFAHYIEANVKQLGPIELGAVPLLDYE